MSNSAHHRSPQTLSPGTGKMIRAVIFDFERTLVDMVCPPDPRRLFREGASRCYAFLSAHELPLPGFDAFCRQQKWIHRKAEWARRLRRGEPDMRRVLRRLCSDYGLQRDQASLAMLAWNWYEPRAEHVQVGDDVLATLTALAAAEIELGLVVNTPWQGQVIDRHLETLGLLEFFPVRAYSTEIGSRKPEARLYHAALDAMRISAPEAIFVSAAGKPDLIGAQRVGMTTVLRSAEKHPGPLPWADHVIGSIADLLALDPLAHIRRRLKPIPTPIPQLIV